jgi:hypothetical protein
VESTRGEEQREPKLLSYAKSLAVALNVKDWNLILVMLNTSNNNVHQTSIVEKVII